MITAVALFVNAARILCASDRAAPVESAVLLSGDPRRRVMGAAELFRRGLARQVVVLRNEAVGVDLLAVIPSQDSLSMLALESLGVPRTAIVLVSDTVTSTVDEAKVIARNLDVVGRRLAIVTSALHSGRARWIFRRVLGKRAQVLALPVDDCRTVPRAWWRDEDTLLAVVNEWLKWGYYLVHYGLFRP